jgi:hypothetical protein
VPITFVGSGTVATGTTSCTPGYPASITAGDLLVLLVSSKYPSNAPSQPSGFSTPTSHQFTGGAGASGVDSGQTTATVFYRIADGTESGTLTVSITSGNCITARIQNLGHSSGAGSAAWDLLGGGGGDSSAGTNWTISTLFTDARAADYLIAGSAVNGNSFTFSAPAITATGLTMGTENLRIDQSSAQGDDSRLVISTHPVSSGTVTSGTVSFAMTASGTAGSEPAGSTVWLRVRELFSAAGTGTMSGFGATGVAEQVFEAAGTGVVNNFDATGTGELVFEATGTGVLNGFDATGTAIQEFIASGTGLLNAFSAAGAAQQVFVASGTAALPSGFTASGLAQLAFVATGTGLLSGFAVAGSAELHFILTGVGLMNNFDAVGVVEVVNPPLTQRDVEDFVGAYSAEDEFEGARQEIEDFVGVRA